MADLKSALYAELSTDVTVSGLVGTRIYPDYADQEATFPYITFEQISIDGQHHFGGVTTLAMSTIQFSVWSLIPEERTSIANAIRSLLDGQRRIFGSGATQTFVNRSENTNNQDTTEEPDDSSQNVVFGQFMDFTFWHIRD